MKSNEEIIKEAMVKTVVDSFNTVYEGLEAAAKSFESDTVPLTAVKSFHNAFLKEFKESMLATVEE